MSDYKYINLTSVGQAGSTSVAQVVYNEFRSQPIVDDVSKYKLSIIRWQAFGLDLPAFIPLIDPTQSDANKTIYNCTLSLTYRSQNFTSTNTVRWLPQFVDQPQPDDAQEEQLLNSRYYWSTTYSHFLELVNNTYLNCYNDILAQLNAAGLPAPKTVVPYFQLENNKFVLYADSNGFGDSESNVETWVLGMNMALRSLLNHFPCVYLDLNTIEFTIVPTTPTNNINGILYYTLIQEESSTDAWSPIESILFSSTLPVVNEDQSPANIIGDGSSTTTSNNFVNSLTDMTYPLTGGALDYLGILTYSPVAEYRWTTLVGSNDLKQLNFSLFYKNRYNSQLYPVNFCVGGGGSISVKLLLQKLK
jgi:hypothetical protein